ncbi:MAG: threonine synthase [Thermodesulfobacteriota bacterium]
MRRGENHLTGFECIRCGRKYRPDEVTYTCPDCGGNLDAGYDYQAIARVISRATLAADAEQSVWRYRPFLPLTLAESPISLRVGLTPLTRAANLGRDLGLERFYLKNDWLNPSGSFKDRASFVILAHCLGADIKHISAASTGNAGTSMACLAAAAGMPAVIFIPHTAPRPKIAQLLTYGARAVLVRGDYGQAFDLCEKVSTRLGWFNRNTGTNPYTREGKKTVSYEIWEQLGYNPPEWVAVSVGDGNIISGVYKGFYDLKQAGLTDRVPRLLGVQAAGSAAIAQAFHGDGVIRRVEAHTIADSISATMPSDGEAALKAVRRSRGTFVAVDDEEILDSLRLLAEREGVFAEPSGVAALAGVIRLVREKTIGNDESVVLIVTGSGLKDVESALKVAGRPLTVDPDPEEAVRLFLDQPPL